MRGSDRSLVSAIRGPITLITVGVLFALNNFTPFRFHQTWPVLLIVFGLLTLLRRSDTPTADFRRITRELSLLLTYEVTRDLPLESVAIQTPLEPMEAPYLSGKKLCFVPILRAGTGLLDGMLDLIPSARVGHIGLYRDPETLFPVEY